MKKTKTKTKTPLVSISLFTKSVSLCFRSSCLSFLFRFVMVAEGGKGQLGSLGWTWTHSCISHGEPARTCWPAQGSLLNVTWQSGREESLGEDGYMCMYG